MKVIKRGILLMNLGSPDSTSVPDVRRYLNEFLMDERVIDVSYLYRLLLVKGLIVPFRAPKSAAAYKTIWQEDGSPLVVLTKQLRDALQELIEEPVAIAMRYGNPKPAFAFEELLKRQPGLEEVIAIPLYPHYAMSSFETAVESVKAIYQEQQYSFKLRFLKPFYKETEYIGALGERIKDFLQQDYDHVLFSYHGVPGRHLTKTDVTGAHCLKVPNCCETDSPAHAHCYRHQCFTTTRLVTQQLGIPVAKYSISFQSRLGKGWLEPFTDIRLAEMPGEGIKKLLILCPAFVSDCLETLEEIRDRGREIFMNAGGTSFTLIPCLNTQSAWVDALAGWIKECDVVDTRFYEAV